MISLPLIQHRYFRRQLRCLILLFFLTSLSVISKAFADCEPTCGPCEQCLTLTSPGGDVSSCVPDTSDPGCGDACGGACGPCQICLSDGSCQADPACDPCASLSCTGCTSCQMDSGGSYSCLDTGACPTSDPCNPQHCDVVSGGCAADAPIVCSANYSCIGGGCFPNDPCTPNPCPCGCTDKGDGTFSCIGFPDPVSGSCGGGGTCDCTNSWTNVQCGGVPAFTLTCAPNEMGQICNLGGGCSVQTRCAPDPACDTGPGCVPQCDSARASLVCQGTAFPDTCGNMGACWGTKTGGICGGGPTCTCDSTIAATTCTGFPFADSCSNPVGCAGTKDCSCGSGQNPHLACVGNACTLINSCGSNGCTSNLDCGGCLPGQVKPHMVCSGLSCITDPTCGVSGCTTDAQCGTCPPTQTNPHMACNGTTCTSIAGCGTPSCSSNPDCGGCAPGESDPHMSCSGTSCASVSGCGPSTCTTDANCGGCACTTPTSTVCSGSVYNDSCNHPTCVGTKVATCDQSKVADTCVGTTIPMSCGPGICQGTKAGCCSCSGQTNVCNGTTYNDSCGQPVCHGTKTDGACAACSCIPDPTTICSGIQYPNTCGIANACTGSSTTGGCAPPPACTCNNPAVCSGVPYPDSCSNASACTGTNITGPCAPASCAGGSICGHINFAEAATTGKNGLRVEARTPKGQLLGTVTTVHGGTPAADGYFAFTGAAIGANKVIVTPLVSRSQSVIPQQKKKVFVGGDQAEFLIRGLAATITVSAPANSVILLTETPYVDANPPSSSSSTYRYSGITNSQGKWTANILGARTYYLTCWYPGNGTIDTSQDSPGGNTYPTSKTMAQYIRHPHGTGYPFPQGPTIDSMIGGVQPAPGVVYQQTITCP